MYTYTQLVHKQRKAQVLDYEQEINSISGWLTQREATILYELAKTVPSRQAIVEIGSWKGRSTACLARGAQDGRGATVYAIDPHTGSHEHRRGGKLVDTYPAFLATLRRLNLLRQVVPLRKTAEEVARVFDHPVGLLFVDGPHGLIPVTIETKLWLGKVTDGGIVAFHDTWYFYGPHLLTAVLLLFSSRLRNPRLIDTLTVVDIVAHNNLQDRLENVRFLLKRLVTGWQGFSELKNRGSVDTKNDVRPWI
jgi:predicted O-methyltransferase YrrM